MREVRAVGAGTVVVDGEAGRRRVTGNVISYAAAISVYEKGGHWEQALSLLTEMQDEGVTRNVIGYIAAFSA